MPRLQQLTEQEELSPEQLELTEAAFNKAIPGQSLTNSPDQPYPWEGSPEYSSVPEAASAIFADMTEEDNFIPLMTALKSGTSVADIASVILYRGFQTGQFNPDLMILLMEPVMYMIMSLAERVGLGDLLGYEGEQSEDEYDLNNNDALDRDARANARRHRAARASATRSLREIAKTGDPAVEGDDATAVADVHGIAEIVFAVTRHLEKHE